MFSTSKAVVSDLSIKTQQKQQKSPFSVSSLIHNANFGFCIRNILGTVFVTGKVTKDICNLVLKFFSMLTYMVKGILQVCEAKRACPGLGGEGANVARALICKRGRQGSQAIPTEAMYTIMVAGGINQGMQVASKK